MKNSGTKKTTLLDLLRSDRVIRPASRLVTFLMLSVYVPYSSIGAYATEVVKKEAARPKAPTSRKMSLKQMEQAVGMYYGDHLGNPYNAGKAKFDVEISGVNIRTGNFSTSATDMSFEGEYGIPINISRVYNTNNIDEGPFGVGWTLSVDMRTTAGGLLKGPGGSVKATPTSFKNRPALEADPNKINVSTVIQPIDAVIATDSSGTEETMQRDVDGVITPPSWDNNQTDPEWALVNGSWVLTSVKVTTPEGTVYQYSSHGHYVDGSNNPGGQHKWNSATDGSESSNIMKIDSITDRQGNETTYTYSGTGTFEKQNGTTIEDLLVGVTGEDGRSVTITWANGSGTGYKPRVTSVSSNSESVTYTYTSGSESGTPLTGLLKTVTTPGGMTTGYTYSKAMGFHGSATNDGLGGETCLLASITDPRGLVTEFYHCYMTNATVDSDLERAVMTYKIVAPNGIKTIFHNRSGGGPAELGEDGTAGTKCRVEVKSGSTVLDNGMHWTFAVDGSTGYYVVASRTYDGSKVQGSGSEMYYDPVSLNLVKSVSQQPITLGYVYNETETERTYNFLNAPLYETTKEKYYNSGYTVNRESQTAYAYWGKDKYYQQKAVTSRSALLSTFGSWRSTMTDYNTSSASAGSRGMTSEVYDVKHGSVSVPSSGSSGDIATWRTNVSHGSTEAASFAYDSVGRVADVYKLAANGSSYIQTKTNYGGSYGMADWVKEAYGTGSERKTMTTTWDWMGRPTVTVDAAGKEFTSTMDEDGRVTQLRHTANWSGGTRTSITAKLLQKTDYGTSGLGLGVPDKVYDYLGNRKQTITYESSGGGRGLPASVVETSIVSLNGTQQEYTLTYGYYDSGDRDTLLVDVNDNGTHYQQKFKYSEYGSVGTPESRKRVFGKMNRQAYVSSTWVDSEDEYLYTYDELGRLELAQFAMGYRTGSSYSGGIGRYAYADYSYDSGGRVGGIAYGTKSWNGSAFVDSPQRLYEAWYDGKGLKTTTKTSTWSGSAWAIDHSKTQAYHYESERDFLTSVDYYSTSSTYSTDSWTYDAAGNRSNSGFAYDELNRMTTSPKSGGTYAYTNDVLGNRTWRDYGVSGVTGVKYTWDELNRLKILQGVGSGANYVYRADGMRVQKIEGISLGINANDEEEVSGYYDVFSTNRPTTRYYYDGQMPVAEDRTFKNGSNQDVMTQVWYMPGARGIDYQSIQDLNKSTSTWGSKSEGYPVYDTHGNNVGAFTWTGSAYSLGNERTYDAWGAVKSGSSPSQQGYCANIGHRQDDESSLQYMRARYYEPWTGRFVNEDAARDGSNWFAYCHNEPINNHDASGRVSSAVWWFLAGFVLSISLLAAPPAVSLVIGTLFSLANLAATLWKEAQISKALLDAAEAMKALESAPYEAAERSHAGVAIDANAKHLGEIYGALLSLEDETIIEAIRIGRYL